jgi:hypothetical protein
MYIAGGNQVALAGAQSHPGAPHAPTKKKKSDSISEKITTVDQLCKGFPGTWPPPVITAAFSRVCRACYACSVVSCAQSSVTLHLLPGTFLILLVQKGKTGPPVPFGQCGRKKEREKSANNAQMGAAQQSAQAKWLALTAAVTLGVLYVFSDLFFLPKERPTSGQRRVVHASAAYPLDQARTSTCQLDAALRQVFVIRTCGPLTPVRPHQPAPQVFGKTKMLWW